MTKKDQPPRPCGLSLGWLKLSVVLNVVGCLIIFMRPVEGLFHFLLQHSHIIRQDH